MTDNKAAIAVRHEAEDAAALFPALLVEAERIAHTVNAGLHGRRRAGPGETFWQHRAYAFGDPVSAIDWRQSARVSDRLYVRENEWEAAAAVYLWRDPSASLHYTSSNQTPVKARRAEVLATALAILLSQAGERIGLLGQERRPFHGRGAPARVLEALLADHEGASSTPPKAFLRSGARAVLFSDFFTDIENLARSVEALSSDGVKGVLVQICDPAEEDFPFAGRVEFQDLESKDRLIFGETASLRSDYQAAFTAHRQALSNLVANTGWNLITHRTDKPAQSALLALYAALSDSRTV
ncbi:MAG: hypothetical protein DHS20C05_20490 [Hyphococcus sp.]|nr:MAG: hypothetical protein DHS20C05_20490 [Marinicaulis sp.]